MASFYKRGDDQWEAKIRQAGFPQLARTFESKSDAMAWAAEVETEMRRGTFVSRALAERKTLGALIGQYVEEVSPLPEALTARSHGSRPWRGASSPRRPWPTCGPSTSPATATSA